MYISLFMRFSLQLEIKSYIYLQKEPYTYMYI